MSSQHQVADNEYKIQAALDNNNGNENNYNKYYHNDIINHEVRNRENLFQSDKKI